MSGAFCEMTSRSTGQRCQKPERWLERSAPVETSTAVEVRVEMRVCQFHGRMLERHGWTFVRELHPVPGIPVRTA